MTEPTDDLRRAVIHAIARRQSLAAKPGGDPADLADAAIAAYRAHPDGAAAGRSRDDLSQPAWLDGEPPKIYRDEWFIAETIYGDRVVLRALPDDYSYDYTTVDHIYLKTSTIKRWMQFPDSEFVSPLKERAENAEAERDALKRGIREQSIAWDSTPAEHMRLSAALKKAEAERDAAYQERHLAAVARAEKAEAERDEARAFIEVEIDRAPEPLRRLGEYLSALVGQDEWPEVHRLLVGAVVASNANWIAGRDAAAEVAISYEPQYFRNSYSEYEPESADRASMNITAAIRALTPPEPAP